MFQIGDCIVYGTNGICKITARGASPFDSKDTREFYVLKTLCENDRTIYSPSETCSQVARFPYTAETLSALFASVSDLAPVDVPLEKRRKDYYRAAMANPSPESCLSMLKTVKARRAACAVQRKRLPAMDSEYEVLAKKLLLQEIRYAFSATREEAEEKLQTIMETL